MMTMIAHHLLYVLNYGIKRNATTTKKQKRNIFNEDNPVINHNIKLKTWAKSRYEAKKKVSLSNILTSRVNYYMS